MSTAIVGSRDRLTIANSLKKNEMQESTSRR